MVIFIISGCISDSGSIRRFQPIQPSEFEQKSDDYAYADPLCLDRCTLEFAKTCYYSCRDEYKKQRTNEEWLQLCFDNCDLKERHCIKACRHTRATGGANKDLENFSSDYPNDAEEIDRLPVTVEKYKLCIEAMACNAPEINAPKTESSPAVVTWYSANAYCKWRRKKLPCRAQWLAYSTQEWFQISIDDEWVYDVVQGNAQRATCNKNGECNGCNSPSGSSFEFRCARARPCNTMRKEDCTLPNLRSPEW